jgi:hypothetical protein
MKIPGQLSIEINTVAQPDHQEPSRGAIPSSNAKTGFAVIGKLAPPCLPSLGGGNESLNSLPV